MGQAVVAECGFSRGVCQDMSRTLRFLVTIFVLFCSLLPLRHAQSAPALERGVAITDPLALQDLDRGRFGLVRMLLPARPVDAPLASSALFALSSMAPVRAALDGEFERYTQGHKADLPNETIGVGTSFDFQLFDRALLYSPDTRFVLAGIVTRMDRAYLSEAHCGEIRLIYRLTRTDLPAGGDHALSPRLPMTPNPGVKGGGENANRGQGAR